ncbi:hypothetical protein NE535_09360, partial [Shewanella sp. SP1S2-7]|nr:hypothetical protein [Shewanella holmiensis]
MSQADVIFYIKIGHQFWAVLTDGQWVAIEDSQMEPLIPFYEFSINTLDLTSALPVILSIDNQEVIIPKSVLKLLAEDMAIDIRDENTYYQTDANQGLNYFYQVIQNQNNSLIAKSGFTTQAVPTDSLRNSFDNSSINQDSFLPLKLSITILDGGDGFINLAETPVVDLYGMAINARDGELLQIVLTDINGVQIILEATAFNERWQLDDIDLSTLSDGQILAIITALEYPGQAEPAFDSSVKDTLANITVEIVDNDNVINATEITKVIIQGTVKNVEDGQTVTVFLTDNLGHSLTLTAIVNGGVWQLSPQDLSRFDDGSLNVTASVNDIAGNPTNASAKMPVDIIAEIDINVITGRDDHINRFEMYRLDFSGKVNDVENGQPITITLTDTAGNQLTYLTTVIEGVWHIDKANVSSLVDGNITFTATTIDLAGNSATSSIVVPKDTVAVLSINANDADHIISQQESLSTSLSGEASNLENGQQVLVWITDTLGQRIFVKTIIENGVWSIDNIDLSGLTDGPLYLKAIAIDIHGNPAFAANSIL